MLVSCVQQSESVICIHIYTFFRFFFHVSHYTILSSILCAIQLYHHLNNIVFQFRSMGYFSIYLGFSFSSVLYKSFVSLVKSIPKYFILFDAIRDGIIFSILGKDWSVVMYRNTTDFCVLILFFFFKLASSFWDLSSLTKDWIQAFCSERAES